jgi:hypothetical protein
MRQEKRRENDRGWKSLLQGIPLAIGLVAIVSGGIVAATLMQATVSANVQDIEAQGTVQRAQENRVWALEQGQAVIHERLKHIQLEQTRLGAAVASGQERILQELRLRR